MPEPRNIQDLFLGEYGWSPAYEHSLPDGRNADDWERPTSRNGVECPAEIQPVSLTYSREDSGYDCSVDDIYHLSIPRQEFIEHLGLKWSIDGVDYRDGNGKLAAFDPTVRGNGPTALLLNKSHLEQYLNEKGLALCWMVIGEKIILGGIDSQNLRGLLKISGAYRFTPEGPKGFLNFCNEIPQPTIE